jgi:hypothetical protein
MPLLSRFSSSLRPVGRALLGVGFGFVCIRFLYAANREADWTVTMLSLVGFTLACWRPAASLLALALGSPLISGLEQTVLDLPCSALLVIASSVWLGLPCGQWLRAWRGGASGQLPPGAPSLAPPRFLLVVELLAAIALISFFMQIWRHSAGDGWGARILSAAAGGTGDASHVLPALVWLHGLFYFRALREYCPADWITPDGIRFAVGMHSAVLVFFLGVQWALDFPARWTPGFQSPYEDIATLGIMAGCLLIFSVITLRRASPAGSLLAGAGVLLLAVAVGASWSRGAWLATGTFLVVLMWLRLPRAVSLAGLLTVLAAVLLLNLNARSISAAREPHLDRLLALVRLEDPRVKSSERFNLYHKAVAMIRVHPWTGHGIGGFRALSPSYARPGDPYGERPQFAHNILLQLAAEQGVPAALLFAVLIGWALGRGISCWRLFRRCHEPAAVRSWAFLALALTLALGAYVQANLTWEILLVHPTQPFSFWFLIAALLAITGRAQALLGATGDGAGERAPAQGEARLR